MTTYACDCGGTLGVHAPEVRGVPDFDRAWWECEACRRRFSNDAMRVRCERAIGAFASVLKGAVE